MRKLTSTLPEWMLEDLKELDEQYPERKQKDRLAKADAKELAKIMKGFEKFKKMSITIEELAYYFFKIINNLKQ